MSVSSAASAKASDPKEPKGTASEKTTSVKPPLRERRPDTPEVIGGRFWIALALLLGMAFVGNCEPLAKALQSPPPVPLDPNSWKAGTVHTIKITVVTADYHALGCAYPAAFGDLHCGHRSTTEPWPRPVDAPIEDNKRNVVQPYRTWPDNLLLSVANLWVHPEVAMRLHNEPPGNIPKEKLARFVVQCQIRFVGVMDRPHLRWFQAQPWSQENSQVMVGNAESCKIVPGD